MPFCCSESRVQARSARDAALYVEQRCKESKGEDGSGKRPISRRRLVEWKRREKADVCRLVRDGAKKSLSLSRQFSTRVTSLAARARASPCSLSVSPSRGRREREREGERQGGSLSRRRGGETKKKSEREGRRFAGRRERSEALHKFRFSFSPLSRACGDGVAAAFFFVAGSRGTKRAPSRSRVQQQQRAGGGRPEKRRERIRLVGRLPSSSTNPSTFSSSSSPSSFSSSSHSRLVFFFGLLELLGTSPRRAA